MKVMLAILALAHFAGAADPGWLISRGQSALADGRPDLAWEHYLSAEDGAARRGDRSTWVAARCQRTDLLLLTEDCVAADSVRPRLSLLGETSGDSARIRLCAARLQLARGDAAGAHVEAWAARQAAHHADEDLLEAATWLALSRSEYLQGKKAEARQSLEEARDLADDEPILDAQADLEEARQGLPPDKAMKLVRRARQIFEQLPWPIGVLTCHERAGELMEQAGNRAAAREAWTSARDLASKLQLEKAARRADSHLK